MKAKDKEKTLVKSHLQHDYNISFLFFKIIFKKIHIFSRALVLSPLLTGNSLSNSLVNSSSLSALKILPPYSHVN